MRHSQSLQGVLYSPYFIILCIGLSFCLGLGWVPLFDLDEGAFTEATREMLATKVFSATYLDGEPRYDKPIFFYWLQALSITGFGYNEWAFRLPSVIAASLWAWVVYRFVGEQYNKQRAHIATLFLVNCLWVALIARSAIADALLNLFLTLIFFDIWRYIKTKENRYVFRLYLWMALGTITKGPIAVAVPLLVSFLYLLSKRELKANLSAYFNIKGWIIFLAVVAPWLIAVYLEQGPGFFKGFIVEHNLKRFSSTRENHGGSLFYYVAILPVILLPLSGLLFPLAKKIKTLWAGQLERYLIIWFTVIFCLFSFSKTQLPHYILNGCVPLIILLSVKPKLLKANKWTVIFGLALTLLFVFLPELLAKAAQESKGYDGASLARYAQALPEYYRWWAISLLVFVCLFCFLPKLRTWQRIVLIGVALNTFMFTQVVSVISGIQQTPIHETIAYLEQHYPEEQVVAYRMHMPSFSVYRKRITPLRAPTDGELALVRIDRLQALKNRVSPLKINTVYSAGGLVLVRAGDTEK